MAQYPNIHKRLEGRMIIWIILLSVLATGLIGGGISGLQGGLDGSVRSTYLEQTERIMAEQNRQMSDELRAELTARDAQMTAAYRKSSIQSGVVALVLGLLAVGGAVLIWKRQDPRRSKLAKKAAYYTALYGEENLEKAMDELEHELSAPLYDTSQIFLSAQWVCGRTGVGHTPYAIPLGAVVGIYRYKTVTRRNGSTFYHYQIMLVDRFMTGIPMLLRDEKQLNEVYEWMIRLCPNVWHGDFPDSFDAVQALDKEEQNHELENILCANRALGLRHCG